MRPLLLLPGVLTSLAAMGCSIATPDAPDAEAASSTATAIVVVERTAGPSDLTPRADAVIARFVRVRQGTVDEQALRIAGAAWDLPAVGTCSATPQAQPALQPRAVDLLDVGVLTLGDREAPSAALGKSTVLVPRTMPDPTGVVSGVFYSARSPEAYAPSSRLQLHTTGGPDLPEGFLVNVASPRDVTDVHVVVSADRERGLDVSWEADGPDARDVVYLDVVGPSGRLMARCTTPDAGHFNIAAAAMNGVDEGQVVVHRLHRESFRTKGIEPGEIRFDTARVVTFKR